MVKVRLEFEVYARPADDRLIVVGYDEDKNPCYIDYQQGLEDDSYSALIETWTKYRAYGEFMWDKFNTMQKSFSGDSLLDRVNEFFWLWLYFETANEEYSELQQDMLSNE